MMTESDRIKHVFLLTIDSLRHDRLNEAYFPECMPYFTNDFATFTDAISGGVATPFAFPGIVTGNPIARSRNLPSSDRTLAELIQTSAYGFSNNVHLLEAYGYGRGFDTFGYNPSTSETVNFVKQIVGKSDILKRLGKSILNTTKKTVKNQSESLPYKPADSVTQFVLNQARPDTRQFIWGHFMDAHFPFIPAAVRDRDIQTAYSSKELRELNREFVDGQPIGQSIAEIERMYDSNIRYLDRELVKFFKVLQERDLYDDALIVVVSDHGEAFNDENVQGHPWDSDPIDALVRTPLLVKYPNNQHSGKQFDHLVQHTDIFATIARETRTDASTPVGTYPLTNLTERQVLSKSNTAVRMTTESGSAIKRRNESIKHGDSLDAKSIAKLDEAPIPLIETALGETPGVDEAEREDLNQQLQDLGYM